MTTLTTLLGDAAARHRRCGRSAAAGGGGPAYYPMARAIIGGLAFSGVLSLFVVPAFYEWFDDLNQWRPAGHRGSARRRNAHGETISSAAVQRSSTL